MRGIDALTAEEEDCDVLGALLSAVVDAGRWNGLHHYLTALDTDPVAVAERLRVVKGRVYPGKGV